MNPDSIQRTSSKRDPTPGRSCLKSVLFVLISVSLILLVLAVGVVYLQVIQLTTPGRNRDIGKLPGISYQDVT